MKRACWMMLAAMLVTSLAAGAVAQETLHPSKLDPSWKGLPFGGNRDQVLEVLKKRIHDRYGALIRDTLDVRDRDRLGREMQKEIDDVEASRIVFDGTQSGWNVSFLREEFVSGQGEEMILVREGNARFYLFFTNGVFYKLIETPEDPAREAAMAALETAYGKPAKVDHLDAKKARLDKAEWAGGPVSLILKDYTRQFQTVMIRWALKDKDEPIQAEVKKRTTGGTALNPLIREAQAPEPEVKEPVDELIGKPAPVPSLSDKPKKAKKAKKAKATGE